MNNHDKVKKLRKSLRDSGITKNRMFMILTCKTCKKEFHIRVNDKSVYTDEIIKNWECMLCRS
jgi:hypothetical protein